MRTLVHLSDIHFGRTDPQLVAPLIRTIREISPSLLAVSGDLTQRARREQFIQARDFLQQLHFPQLVVPGNHDVPLFNLPVRWLAPLAGYKRYISQNLSPIVQDEEMVVVGLNSARSGSFARGRLNAGQVERAAARLQAATGPLVKIVVTHHPFELPPLHGDEHIIGRARMAMDLLARVGVDVFLAGHLHVSHVGQTAERYKIANHSALVVQAGTLSTRGRGEPNSFNVLRISHELITVERMAWQPAAAVFQPSWTGAFGRTAHGWVARPA